MVSSNLIRSLLLSCFVIFNLSTFADSPVKGEPDTKGNVVFTVFLENLPLNEADVHKTAIDYLNKEYKTTKYSDIKDIKEKGIAVGSGTINSFYTDNGLTSSEVFSADYYLRIDSKDNKARVQLIFNNYDQMKFSDNGNKQVETIQISSVAPFADSKNKKRYTKAYEKLQEYAQKVIDSVSQFIKAASPEPEIDDNW